MKDRRILIPAIIVLTPLLYSIVSFAVERSTRGDDPFLDVSRTDSTLCVREAEYMRYRHMDLLKEMRVAVVRDGIRSELTLDTCRGCHADREQFCNRCHSQANVNLDCFGCHYYPAKPGMEQGAHDG